MDDAAAYRAALIKQNLFCSEIVTRDGHRLAATGKIGGQGNSINHDFRTRGVRFAKTRRPEILQLRTAIQDLTDLLDWSNRKDQSFASMNNYEIENKPFLDSL